MSLSREAYRAEVYRRYGLTCPPRWATLRDIRRPTLGGKVARLAAALGTPLMPWQRYVADVALEIDPATGVFAYRSVGVTVPRQSGKTTLILALACHRGMAWQRQQIVYAAQNGTAARKKWEDDHVRALIDIGWAPDEGQPLLPTHRAKIRRANGREGIIWRKTRSVHGLHANTESSGHGPTLHLGLLDEYFAQIDDRIYAAWSPAMITVASAQDWWFSTAGTKRSVPMNEAKGTGRDLAAAGGRGRVAYFEWSDDKDNDRRDQSLWPTYMPALCPTPGACDCSPHWRHTQTIEAISTELEKASTPAKLAEFDRAFRNITREDDEVVADPRVPTVEAWGLLADEASVGGDVVALGIDAYGGNAAIDAAGFTPEGLPRLVVLEHGPGTDWVVTKLPQLIEKLDPVAVAIDDKSESGKLLTRLIRAGLQRMGREAHRGGIWVPTTTELAAACGSFADKVNGGGLVHKGQKMMEQALAMARTRSIGDGAYAYGRRISSADITPLNGGVLALEALERFAHLAEAERSVYETRGLATAGGDE
jgi:hypothetical protein